MKSLTLLRRSAVCDLWFYNGKYRKKHEIWRRYPIEGVDVENESLSNIESDRHQGKERPLSFGIRHMKIERSIDSNADGRMIRSTQKGQSGLELRYQWPLLILWNQPPAITVFRQRTKVSRSCILSDLFLNRAGQMLNKPKKVDIWFLFWVTLVKWLPEFLDILRFQMYYCQCHPSQKDICFMSAVTLNLVNGPISLWPSYDLKAYWSVITNKAFAVERASRVKGLEPV